MNLILRPYQIKIISEIRQAYKQGFRAPLLQSPCGSGKTVMFAFITDGAAKKGNRVIILVHRQELLMQTSRALFNIGVSHGIVAPGHSMTHDNVQVASIQTMVRRLVKLDPQTELVIIDEAAHSVASNWAKVISYFRGKILGVTATPERLDGRGLGEFYDKLILGPTYPELISQGFLSRPVVYAPPIDLDMKGVKTKFGDYVQGQVEERIDKPVITGCAISHYKKICPGVPAIAFCVSVKHAEHVAQEFNCAGIKAESIDGKLSDIDRRLRINNLATGRINILTSCEIISEGTDIPVVTAAILLRPTQSKSLYLQQCGRVLRPHPDKKYSIILDHVGNAYRHGFPDDIREWSLEGFERKKRIDNQEPPVDIIQCGSCYLCFKKSLRICPECGWKYIPEDITPEQVDGELREMTEHDKKLLRYSQMRERAEADTLDKLIELGKRRGYRPGWAHFVWKARQQA